MEKIIKRTLWNITFASILRLIAYIVTYAIWGATLSRIENPTLVWEENDFYRKKKYDYWMKNKV